MCSSDLPMALTASMMKDAIDLDGLAVSMLEESKNAMQEMDLSQDEEESEI